MKLNQKDGSSSRSPILAFRGIQRAISWEEQQREKRDRFASAVIVAASIIAAVRLAREEIKPSPKVAAVVAEGVALARMILDKVVR